MCIAQVNRLPYRDFAQNNVVSLVPDSKRPNQRGPPSTSGRVLEYPTYSMLECARIILPSAVGALRAVLYFTFQRITRLYQPDLLAVCSVGTGQPMERAVCSIAAQFVINDRGHRSGLTVLCLGKIPSFALACRAN